MNKAITNRSRFNRSLRYLTILFAVLVLAQSVFGIYIYTVEGDEAGILLFISALSSLIAVLPFFLGLKKFDLFSPLVLFAASLTIGSMLRVFYVYRYQEYNSRAEFLLFNSSYGDLASNSFFVFLGVASFVIGYLINTTHIRVKAISWIARFRISENRLFLFSIVFGIFGAVTGAIFLFRSGIDLSSGLMRASSKASIVYQGADGSSAVGAGFERFLSKFAEFPFIVLSCLLIFNRIRNRIPALILCAFLAIPVVLIPFLYSSRSTVVMSFISIVIFCYYFGKIKITQLLGVVAAIVVVVFLMGELRFQNKTGWAQERNIVDAFIGSGNGVDFIRTAGIMERVPSSTDYLYGVSYAYVFAIPIPRQFWISKPEIGLGPYIKSEVFKDRVVDKNGWPSGMIGEAYLNFGLMGTIIVMTIYGWFAALVYNIFRPYLGVSEIVTFIYAMIAWRFGFGLPGLNFAHGISQVLTILIPAVLFLYLVKSAQPRMQI